MNLWGDVSQSTAAPQTPGRDSDFILSLGMMSLGVENEEFSI